MLRTVQLQEHLKYLFRCASIYATALPVVNSCDLIIIVIIDKLLNNVWITTLNNTISKWLLDTSVNCYLRIISPLLMLIYVSLLMLIILKKSN